MINGWRRWRKSLGRLLAILTAACMGAGACGAAETAKDSNMTKPGIILVAFGTSIPEAQKVFDFILANAQKQFPDYDIIYGFTAHSIVKTLRDEKRDHGVMTIEEAVTEMKKRGHVSVVLQSLHVSPGQKDAELQKVDTMGLKTAFGKPLLTTDADLEKAAAALKAEMEPGVPNIICGHGNDKFPEYNAQMIAFDKLIRKAYPGAVLCTVEGQPGHEILKTEVKTTTEKAGGKVHFIPMMIVAGDHIMNDVNGNDEDSWKNLIGAKATTVSKPLGYNPAILRLFWDHLKTALSTIDAK